MALLAGGLVYLFMNVDFIPHPASAERGMIDRFMQILFAIASIFFSIIVTVLAYGLIFFRRQRADTGNAKPIRGNTALELTWTLVPLFIVIGLSIYGAIVLDRMTSSTPTKPTVQSVFSLGVLVPRYVSTTGNATPPALTVNVTASRFAWEFYYPAYSIKSYILVVPVDRRIRFDMASKDVIHSFWVQPWGPSRTPCRG